MDKIIVNVSSYSRIDSLEKTINSIYNQCDVINVALNDNHNTIPLFLYDTKINLFLTDNSLGDAFKFMCLTSCENGYFLTIDDDLIYPPDYVEYMIGKCKEYNNTKVITLHGRNFSKFPIGSYYKSATERYSCLGLVKHDVKVQFGGTGVMCFHTNLMRIPLNYFQQPNMADVWVGKYCIENNIEVICVRHTKGYINYTHQSETIYDTHSRSDRTQTLVANSIYDKTIKLDFSVIPQEVEVTIEPEKLKEVSIDIKPTIEKTQKMINYEKVNQIFNRTPSHTAIKPKNVGSSSSLKTNALVLQKLNKNKGRR